MLPLLALACGGDDDDGVSGLDGNDETPSGPVTGLEATDEQAQRVVPDLADIGFEPVQTGRDPLVPPSIGMARALYQNSGEGRQAIVQTFVFDSDAGAEEHFATLADAYTTVPIGALLDNPIEAGDPGLQPPANQEGAGPDLGEEARSFVTLQSDSNNNGVTTDVYRFGNLVFVVQLLASAADDHMELRSDIAQRVLSRAAPGS